MIEKSKIPDTNDLIVLLRDSFNAKFEIIAIILNKINARTATGMLWNMNRVKRVYYVMVGDSLKYINEKVLKVKDKDICTFPGCNSPKDERLMFLCQKHYREN